MERTAEIARWAERLGPDATPREVAVFAGVPEALVSRQLAASPAPAHDIEAGQATSARAAAARTLDLLERRLPLFSETPADFARARRYALRCLSGLLLPSGPIARMRELPYPLSRHWRAHVFGDVPLPSRIQQKIDAHRARTEDAAARYRARAEALKRRYVGLLPGTNWQEALHDVTPLAADVPPFRLGGPAREQDQALAARFGPPGQMLAGSKSRSPWSVRCMFNARVRFEDGAQEELWTGDQWLFPPSGCIDPRAGALDIARTTLRPVGLVYEHRDQPVWVACPDGSLQMSEDAALSIEAVCRMLDEAGWPPFREWPAYPVEHRVAARESARV